MGFPYDFVKALGQVGVGVEALGFTRPQTLPAYDGWINPRHQVRRQLDPQRPGFMKMKQQYQPVSIEGNGNLLQGQLELQKLAQLMGASGS